MDDYIILQHQSDLIRSFLKTATEPFDDWDWDGNELVVFLNEKMIERYSQYDLFTLIADFPYIVCS